MATATKTIHILGSLNMDLVCHTDRLPVPGETLLGQSFSTVPGGKGANQAVAAARLGANSRMIGRIGNDDFGHRLLASLQAAGVDTRDVDTRDIDSHSTGDGEPLTTGIASIVVDAAGNNQIIVVPGANGQVNTADVHRLGSGLQAGDILLMQLEIPITTVVEAATVAQQQQVTVMLDPAPAPDTLPEPLYGLIDIFTPNQVEAATLVGFPVDSINTAFEAARVLIGRGIGTVIVKLGAQGAVVVSRDECFHQPAFAVQVVDTVAAGDAFNGALAVALADGLPLPAAVRFATATAALSVTRSGAQPSMPTRSEVDTRLSL
jgi:ribokinase